MGCSSQSVCPQAGKPSAPHRDSRFMSKRHQMTISDYAVMAVCPSLIVLLLSSLVYFLILCAYQGAYSGRIGYIWFMFILGAVNIARLSIEESRKYTLVYSAALGLATFFVLSRFQSISGPAAAFAPFVNAFLIGVVWLLADRITYDCTLIDDDDDASGQGLLDGLSRPRDEPRDEPSDAVERLADPPVSRPGEPLGDGNTRPNERPTEARKRKRRPPQPGRTVLWLTAAALPLFGFGQAALRSDPAAISSASRALAVYLFATLSLLVATSFLGVRRYLRQRGVAMPRDVSTAWLGGGIALVALILGVSFLLPQPGKLLADLKLPSSIESPDWLTPSRLGWGSETANPSPQAAGANPSEAPADASPESNPGDGSPGQTATQPAGQGANPGQGASQTPGQSGQSGQPDAAAEPGKSDAAAEPAKSEATGQPQQADSSGQSSESGQPGQAKPPASSGQSSTTSPQGSPPSGQSGQTSQSNPPTQQGEPQPTDPSAGDSKPTSSPSESAQGAAGEPQPTGQEANESAETERRQDAESSADQAASDSADPTQAEPTAAPPPQSAPPSLNLPSLSGLIKALIYLVLLAIVAAFLWLHRDALADFWRRLQAWLAGNPAPPAATATAAETTAPPLTQRPFASFSNPLVAGADPRRAVIETFQAAEAWFGEHGQPRKRDETPHEYARRLQTANSGDRQAVEHLSAAYNRVVYGGERPSRQDLQHIQRLWQSVFHTR